MPPPPLAVFVTPHGFGHAARVCAVLEALAEQRPLRPELFTTVPEWFFADSLTVPFGYHAVGTDIGLVQRDALDEDLGATVRALDAFLPWPPDWIAGLAEQVRALGCAAVLSDIAPLGIAVARAAGLPSALVENFTWEWIYESYGAREPGLARHARELAGWFAAAAVHIQTAPVCRPRAGSVRVAPVGRPPRHRRDEVRRQLGVTSQQRAVLLTMGGIAWDYGAMVGGGGPRLPEDVVLVVPGGASEPRQLPWARLLPFHSAFYHPDLVAACDAVVGKLGYSTFAECWGSGVPFGYVPRDAFAESPVLAAAVEEAHAGMAVDAASLRAADWGWLTAVLTLPRLPAGRSRGNAAAAAAVAVLLPSS